MWQRREFEHVVYSLLRKYAVIATKDDATWLLSIADDETISYYYPDCKTMILNNKEIPMDSRRTILTLMTLISGRLELATPYNTMSDGIVHDLSRVFPVLTTPKSFRPVDMLLEKTMPEVYVYDVTPTWSQVILFNTDPLKKTITRLDCVN